MLNDEERKKNIFYSGRNKRYLEEIRKFLDNEILIKGFYGTAFFEVKVQDGIIQETTKDIKTKIIVSREQKDDNQKKVNDKPVQTIKPFNVPKIIKTEQKAGI